MSSDSYRNRNGLPCSFCRQKGHQLPTCQEYLVAKRNTDKLLQTSGDESPDEKVYLPVLDVVKDPGCIRAVLSAYGRNLSGRKDGNIHNLKELATDLGRVLIFHKVSSSE